MQALRAKGVDSRPYVYPLTSMPMYPSGTNPVAQTKSRIGVNLPTFVGLAQDQVAFISEVVNETLASLQPLDVADLQL